MSTKLDTIWSADPHTLAKIEILKFYLNAWLPIIATTFPRPLLYIDGFSGPGRYKGNEDGSPIAALKTICRFLASCDRVKSPEIRCAFIELDQNRHDVLKTAYQHYQSNSRIRITSYNTSFENGIKEIQKTYPKHFTGDDPVFVFADPFGVKGIPLNTLKECINSNSGELLINLDADGIHRVYAGQNNNCTQQLDEIFGSRCWESVLNSRYSSMSQQAIKILELYKQQLRDYAGARYIYSFEMRNKAGSINYYLVFASKHREGLIKMKEAMRRVDQNGDYCFSDADNGQSFLFEGKSMDRYSIDIYNRFKGMELCFDDVEKYCLCETPAKSVSELLVDLEKKNKITVIPYVGCKRIKGSFKRDKVDKIKFEAIPEQATLF